jgi:hypothetical protein
VCVYLGIATGCKSTTNGSRLIGKWECTNLKAIEHISQFRTLSLDFAENNQVVSRLIDKKGLEIVREKVGFVLQGKVLRFEGDDTLFRYSIEKQTLTLTIIQASTRSDIGKSLKFKRKLLNAIKC